MRSSTPLDSESNKQGIVAKGCGTLFFGLFAVIGIAVTGIMIWSFGQTLRPYFWSKTACTVVDSGRPTDGIERTSKSKEPVVIRYRYEAGGQSHESQQLTKGMKESLDSRRVEKLLMKYQPGIGAVCYVNPKNPEEAVLERGPLWPVLFILIPIVFMAVGAGGVVGIWRGEEWKRRTASRVQNSKGVGTAAKLFFFGLFLLIGGILTYVIAVRPVQKYFAAKNWPETPCKILSSSVSSHSSSKGGTTYSVDITYSYRIDGRDFQSDTYSVMTGSSSGRASKERVVSRYPVGFQTVCYVNPIDPTDALLSRELSRWLLIGLIPGLFLLVGIIGVGSTARSALQGVLARSSAPVLPGAGSNVVPTIPLSITPAMTGPAELKPEYSPFAKLAGAMFGALFWNGITGVFVWFGVNSIIEGRPEWFLIVFITPFVLIGLFLIGLVGSTFLNLFNPRMRLTVNSASIPLGGKLNASWAFDGSSDRIKHFKLALEGREEITTGSGKSRTMKRNVFATLPVIDTTEPQLIARGHASVEIPTEHRPTDDEGNQKVVWTLKAVGEIPRYPDFEEEYEIKVMAREVH